MPLGRGENIGSAYIKIYADGRGLDKSIRDSFDEAEPGIREGAEHHADAYSDAYNKRLRSGYKKEFGKTQKELFDAANDALTKSLARTEFAERTFKSAHWKDFKKRMANEYGDAGRLAAKELRRQFEISGDLDALPEAMERMGPRIDAARAEIVRRNAEALAVARAKTIKETEDFNKSMEKLALDRAKAEKQASQEIIEAERRTARERREALGELTKTYKEYRHQADLLERRDRDAAMSRRELVKGFRDLRTSTDRAGFSIRETLPDIDRYERHVGRLTPTLGRLNRGLDDTSDRIGSAFGRGSRNNFLNFFGSVVRNATRLLFLLPKVAENIVQFGKGFATAFSGAGGGLSGLQAGLLTLGPALAAGVTGVVVFAGALAALSLIIGPLIALISLLAGMVLALAGTIAFALVGAVAALASVVAPLILGFGGLAIAIGTMGKKSGDLKNAIKDVKDAASGLGEAFRSTGFDKAPEQLARVSFQLIRMRPLARAAGEGMSDFVDGLLDGFDSPSFAKFVDVMEKHLPSILGKLGRASGNVFNAMWGVMRSLVPLAERFTGWLERITDEWDKWSNSKKGQAAMKQFWKDAEDSLKSFWGLLKETGGLIGDMFSTGRESGDRMFDGLTDAVKRFRAFIAEPVQPPTIQSFKGGFDDPTKELREAMKPIPGKTNLQQFFDDAEKLARSLGRATEQALKLMDELDNSESRKEIIKIIDAISDLIGVIKTALDVMDLLINPAGAQHNGIIQQMADDVGKVKDKIAGLFDPKNYSLTGINIGEMIQLPNWPKILSNFDGLGKRIKNKIGKVNIGDIITGAAKAVASLLNPFDNKGKKIRVNIGHVNIADIIVGAAKAVSSLINPFDGADKKIYQNIFPVNVADIIVGAAKALLGLVGEFAGASQKIYQKIFPVNVANIITGAGEAVASLLGHFVGVAQTISNMLSGIHVSINWPDPPGWLSKVTASGGIFQGAQTRIIGEAGAEAVVPLNRPLSMVDPSVRWLSAFAQGKEGEMMASGGVAGAGGRTVNVDMTVVTTAVDPRAAAIEVTNHLVAVGY